MKKSARPKARRSRRGRRGLYLTLAIVAATALAIWWLGRDRGPWMPERAARQEYAPYTGPLELPREVLEADPEIREAYEFAARRPDVLHYLPCFCGCRRDGHRSNYDCFIDQVESGGEVDIDQMGFT